MLQGALMCFRGTPLKSFKMRGRLTVISMSLPFVYVKIKALEKKKRPHWRNYFFVFSRGRERIKIPVRMHITTLMPSWSATNPISGAITIKNRDFS